MARGSREQKRSLIGMRFGRLVVTDEVGRDARRKRLVRVHCDCGNERTARVDHLIGGRSHSCGCLSSDTTTAMWTTHGEGSRRKGETAEYRCWAAMIRRCENPNSKGYDRYGGRGITVCRQWRESYATFLADLGRRPSAEHSLDRINVNGNYEPGNCRWATATEQARNRRQPKPRKSTPI